MKTIMNLGVILLCDIKQTDVVLVVRNR
ncbi:hypothetical protein PE36_05128 [Moritella sp. PE36]|nr:hypothetical protein PE36_05128 [Moritella sp. PE36]